MTGRLLPTLVALVALAFPAGAVAQTSDYGDPPPLSNSTGTTPAPTPPPEEDPAPAPEADDTGGGNVAAETAAGGNPTPAPNVAANTTGTAPSTLAYTGSETWLVALIGLLALAGGVALVRTSRV